MAVMPRRVKYRKSQKGKTQGVATRGNKLRFGEYGLKAIANGFIKGNQIEACRVVIARKMRGAGRMWMNMFPHKPITKKPAETRMGKGKGDLDHWVAVAKRGAVLIELGGIPGSLAKEVLRLCAFKLPVQTKFISRGTEH